MQDYCWFFKVGGGGVGGGGAGRIRHFPVL